MDARSEQQRTLRRGSTFANGVRHDDPHLPELDALRLANSDFVAGYAICQEGRCTLLTDSATRAGDGDAIELRACSK